MIGLSWRMLGGVAAAVALAGGAYAIGAGAGANRVLARHAKIAARIEAAAARIRTAIDRTAGAHAAARTEQVTTERIIYRDAIRIIDRPVYRSICADADGVQLLDRARDNANRGLTGGAAVGPAVAAADAAPSGRDAGRAAVPDRQP